MKGFGGTSQRIRVRAPALVCGERDVLDVKGNEDFDALAFLPSKLHPTPYTLHPIRVSYALPRGTQQSAAGGRIQGYLAHKKQRPPKTLQ